MPATSAGMTLEKCFDLIGTRSLDAGLRDLRNCASMAYLVPMRPEELLTPTAAGLCCRPGGFHIDPVRAVARALITHGHSDHARPMRMFSFASIRTASMVGTDRAP
jgi:hypothetical protein